MQSYQTYFTLFATISPILAMKGYDFLHKAIASKAPRAIPGSRDERFIKEIGTTEVSFCVWMRIDADPDKRRMTVVSYASKDSGSDNEFLVEVNYGDTNFTSICLNNKAQRISPVPVRNAWTHFCCTWKGESGEAHLYFDGESVGGIVGHPVRQIKGDGILVLGQDQDSFNSRYSPADGFKGRLTQFNLWNKTLTPDEVYSVFSCELQGNIVNWEKMRWTVNDNLEIHWSDAPCSDYVCKLRSCRPASHSMSSPLDMYEAWEFAADTGEIHLDHPQVKGISAHSGYYDKRMHNVKKFTMCAWVYINATALFAASGHVFELFHTLKAPPMSFYSSQQVCISVTFQGHFALYFENYPSSQLWDITDFELELVHAWHHICFMWKSQKGRSRVFVNGEMVGDAKGMATGKVYDPLIFEIGHAQYDLVKSDNLIHGVIYKAVDINVWNRFLKRSEVSELYCNDTIAGNFISWKIQRMIKCRHQFTKCDM